MSVKLNKANKDILNAEQKIIEWQGKLKDFQKVKYEIENLEMIDFLRKNKVQQEDLKTWIDQLHDEKGALVPLKTEITEENKIEEN